jgi:uncharacterized protein (TIGR04255 family)
MATLQLPEPSTERLARSPLQLVTCQVRHENRPTAVNPDRALSIHALVSDQYPVVEELPSQELSITAGPGGFQATQGASSNLGWRFRTSDSSWVVTILPDWFSLETSSYEDWPDFQARLQTLTDAVARHVRPKVERRLGLRYVNRIAEPPVKHPRDWEGLINSFLLGPALDPALSPALRTAQQLLHLDAEDDMQVIVRHGFAREDDGGHHWAYLLDQDCFKQRGKPFEAKEVLEDIDRLHLLALQVFQVAGTPQLLAYLRGENGDDAI